jgi:hypothetical protein
MFILPVGVMPVDNVLDGHTRKCANLI